MANRLAFQPEWMTRAACRDANPEWFYPKSTLSPEAQQALRICRGCPVAEECFRDAMENNEHLGIRGGKTPRQRKKLRKLKETSHG